MRRFVVAVLGAVSLMLVSAGSALAQSNVPPGNDDVLGDVIDDAVRPPGGTAFTGTEITVWMIMAGVLLILGVGSLLAARRRARSARA